MTPFQIGILMHYFTCADDAPDVQRNPSIWGEVRDGFLGSKLIREAVGDERRHGASWVLTERGEAYCKALTEVPLPTARWVVEWPNDDARTL